MDDSDLSASKGITVVMAAYNAETTIDAALASLLGQHCSCPFEVIVIDDASTDATAARVRARKDDRLVLVQLNSNVGRAAARHEAILRARYDILVIADADDVSLPGRLQNHWRALADHPGTVASSGQLLDLSVDGRVSVAEYQFPVSGDEVDAAFVRGRMGVAHPASAFRLDWYLSSGGYDPQLLWCEDFDLFLRGWRKGGFAATATPLIQYRRRTFTTSWLYWWQSDRYHRAILARHRSNPTHNGTLATISPYLYKCSTPSQRAISWLRYVKYRAWLLARRQPNGTA